MQDFTSTFGNSAAEALPATRAQFIRRTYSLLAASILAFIVVEGYLFASGAAYSITNMIFGRGGVGWLPVLIGFMVIGWISDKWAVSQSSKGVQFLGLGLYIVAEALIFAPLIVLSMYQAGDATVLAKAGIVTMGLFLGLTAVVFMTRTDFSFLRSIIVIGSFMALGLIVASFIFGFGLGSIFSFAMVALAGTTILYNTSGVMNRYNTNQHVAAALTLFAGIALLFWYILRIFSSRR
jgi:FtsH-binding integral membrane protein